MTWRAATPHAVAARGDVALRLVRRLLAGRLDGLRGVVADNGWVVILGDPPPWCDGATFLGVVPEAPDLYLPTRRRWEVPAELLQRRILAMGRPEDAPLAWLDDALVPLGPARPLDRSALQALLEDAAPGRPALEPTP